MIKFVFLAATALAAFAQPAAAQPRSGLYFGAASGPSPFGCLVRVLLVNETRQEIETLSILANIENGNASSVHVLRWDYLDPGKDRIAEAYLPSLYCQGSMVVTFRRIEDCEFSNGRNLECSGSFRETQVVANGAGRSIPVRFRHQAP